MVEDWRSNRNRWGEVLHPGTIVFVDENEDSVEEVPADAVPPAVRWHGTARGRVPITLVVYRGREVHQYDPDGNLLAVAFSSPPSAAG